MTLTRWMERTSRGGSFQTRGVLVTMRVAYCLWFACICVAMGCAASGSKSDTPPGATPEPDRPSTVGVGEQAGKPNASPVPSPEPASPDVKKNPYLAVLQLNYCQESLARCVSYNNRVILDQEYKTIISNLDLSGIPDREIVELRQSLLGLLNKLSINDEEGKRLQQKYEKKVKKAFRQSLSSALGRIGGNPLSVWGAIASAASSAGSAYFDYQARVEEYKDELDEGRWELKKDEMIQLTEMRKDVLGVSWEIIKRYGVSDELRVSEDQFGEFIERAKEEDVRKRIRRLEYIQDGFKAYPPFWYYLGQAYQQVGDDAKALGAYDVFDRLYRDDVFRCDPHAAAVSMDRIRILGREMEKPKLQQDLARICNDLPPFCGPLAMLESGSSD